MINVNKKQSWSVNVNNNLVYFRSDDARYYNYFFFSLINMSIK